MSKTFRNILHLHCRALSSSDREVHHHGDQDVDGRIPQPARFEPPAAHRTDRLLIEPARIERAGNPNVVDATVPRHDELQPHRALDLGQQCIRRVPRLGLQRSAAAPSRHLRDDTRRHRRRRPSLPPIPGPRPDPMPVPTPVPTPPPDPGPVDVPYDTPPTGNPIWSTAPDANGRASSRSRGGVLSAVTRSAVGGFCVVRNVTASRPTPSA